MRLLWLTDLHLEYADAATRRQFFETLRRTRFDAAVITGDISSRDRLAPDLLDLGRACAPRPVRFVLGNHDFFGSSFSAVDGLVADTCRQQRNLNHLGQGEVIQLTDIDALIGHRGWADGRAGQGLASTLRIKGSECIEDLRCGLREEVFRKMEALGRASGRYFLDTLPDAMKRYRRVWIATHFPPFSWASTFNGKPCGARYAPYYSNCSAGGAIRFVARRHQKNRITVLCGHTHDRASVCFSPNISVCTGGTKRGHPQMQWIFDI